MIEELHEDSNEEHHRHWEDSDWDDYYKGKSTGDTPVDAYLKEFAENLAPGTALDLGCGTGQNTLWLAEKGWKVTGVDISVRAINAAENEAKKRNIYARFIVGNIISWTTDEQYDLVFSTYALPSGEEADKTIHKAAGSVKLGGNFFVAEIHRDAAGTEHSFHPDELLIAEDVIKHLLDFDIHRSEKTVHDHGHGSAIPTFVVWATKKRNGL